MAKLYSDDNTPPYLIPEVVEVTPLYEINSTAYAVKVEYNMKDSIHSSVIMLERADGDPIPTNMNTLKEKVLSGNDYQPHHSMQWIIKTIEDPDQGRPVRIDDNTRALEI